MQFELLYMDKDSNSLVMYEDNIETIEDLIKTIGNALENYISSDDLYIRIPQNDEYMMQFPYFGTKFFEMGKFGYDEILDV